MRMPGRAKRCLDFRYHRATIHRSMPRRPGHCSRALTLGIQPARKRQPDTIGESRSYAPGWSAYWLRRARMATSGWSSWLKGSCGWSPNRDALIDRVGVYPYIDPRQKHDCSGRSVAEPVTSAGTWLTARSFCIAVPGAGASTANLPLSAGTASPDSDDKQTEGVGTWHVPPEP